ncbi:MAG: hypothetical protein AAFQ14_14365 [Cyanobacteria bacterium J06621_12]
MTKPKSKSESTSLERAYEEFREHVYRVLMSEDRGMDYILSLCEVGEDDTVAIAYPGSYKRFILEPIKEDGVRARSGIKNTAKAYKPLFDKDDKTDVLYRLLYEIMPDSLKEIRREIEKLRAQNLKWREIEAMSGIKYSRLNDWYLGTIYPNMQSLKNMRTFVPHSILIGAAYELHGEKLEIKESNPKLLYEEAKSTLKLEHILKLTIDLASDLDVKSLLILASTILNRYLVATEAPDKPPEQD